MEWNILYLLRVLPVFWDVFFPLESWQYILLVTFQLCVSEVSKQTGKHYPDIFLCAALVLMYWCIFGYIRKLVHLYFLAVSCRVRIMLNCFINNTFCLRRRSSKEVTRATLKFWSFIWILMYVLYRVRNIVVWMA